MYRSVRKCQYGMSVVCLAKHRDEDLIASEIFSYDHASGKASADDSRK